MRPFGVRGHTRSSVPTPGSGTCLPNIPGAVLVDVNPTPFLGKNISTGDARLSTAQIYTRVSTGRMLKVYQKAHPHAQGMVR